MESQNPLIRTIYEKDPSSSAQATKGKLAFISVGSKFRTQLGSLMEKLRSTVSLGIESLIKFIVLAQVVPKSSIAFQYRMVTKIKR